MDIGSLITRPGQVQYGSLLLGADTRYGWRELTGWEELPALDSGTVARSGGHGAYPGALLAQTRTVGISGMVIRAPRAEVGHVVGQLAAGTSVTSEELPLVVWLDERGPLLVWARVVRRAVPVGTGYRLGTIIGGAVEWEASDPRRYELAEQSATARLPQPEPGLKWPLTWPLFFGAPGSTGTLSAHNDGTAPTHPTVEFHGPVTTPSLTNLATGAVLEYDLRLAAEDVLTVDTAAGTVLLNGTASRLYTVTARSAPEQSWTLPPGASDFHFRTTSGTSDPRASATVRWRSAYW
ncbi:phage distal tail protein [Streptomyces sp. NPDC099050]|uniref:phage distal tail protein n=1 Tax=Streptomyces sp. NPDC099050 TaxID=3366100 RepID=UPI003826A29F